MDWTQTGGNFGGVESHTMLVWADGDGVRMTSGLRDAEVVAGVL